jgi:hypothetical protein
MDINPNHRAKFVAALPGFMNQCEGGACGNTDDDIVPPSKFEMAALEAMNAVKRVYREDVVHWSQRKAILMVLREQIDKSISYL